MIKYHLEYISKKILEYLPSLQEGPGMAQAPKIALLHHIKIMVKMGHLRINQ
jgi:hypothetical protein